MNRTDEAIALLALEIGLVFSLALGAGAALYLARVSQPALAALTTLAICVGFLFLRGAMQ